MWGIKTIEPIVGISEYSTIINDAFQNYSSVLVKNGVYNIDISKILNLKSNTMITFEPNAVFKIQATSLDRYSLFTMDKVENVIINNPNLMGDKYTHIGDAGQWGHGISIVNGSRNIVINNATCKEFWGDGIYINDAYNVSIIDPVLDDNRRQGISVIKVDGLKIVRPKTSNTQGQNPAAGIDFECNFPGEYFKNVHVYNPYFYKNGQDYDYGVVISLKNLYSLVEKTEIDINIYSPIIDYGSLVIGGARAGTKGQINIYNPIIKNAKRNGLHIIDCDSNEMSINIQNPIIIDPNRSNVSNLYSNGIQIENSTKALNFTGNKNIKIKNPVLELKDNPCAAIRVTDTSGKTAFENCEIKNPIVRGVFSNDFTVNSSGVRSILDTSFKLTQSNEAKKGLFLLGLI